MGFYSQIASLYHWTPGEIDELDLLEILTMLSVGYKLKRHYEDCRDKKPEVYIDQCPALY